jgi:membrane protein involved in colicin uptake
MKKIVLSLIFICVVVVSSFAQPKKTDLQKRRKRDNPKISEETLARLREDENRFRQEKERRAEEKRLQRLKDIERRKEIENKHDWEDWAIEIQSARK